MSKLIMNDEHKETYSRDKIFQNSLLTSEILDYLYNKDFYNYSLVNKKMRKSAFGLINNLKIEKREQLKLVSNIIKLNSEIKIEINCFNLYDHDDCFDFYMDDDDYHYDKERNCFYDIHISDEDLKYLSNVRYLSINGCNFITDNGLKYLTNIYELNIIRCSNITKKY